MDRKLIYKYYIYNKIKANIYLEFTSLYCYIIKINKLVCFLSKLKQIESINYWTKFKNLVSQNKNLKGDN